MVTINYVFAAGQGVEGTQTCCSEKFCQGYDECRDHVVRYMIESLGYQPADTQGVYSYLDTQLDKRKASLPGMYRPPHSSCCTMLPT